ncbi:MAG: discoidin domain-containing protein [Erysipelotrichales bacterium]|nr:discoidin domain-containing protein [Erysipelotrichales bacterium]
MKKGILITAAMLFVAMLGMNTENVNTLHRDVNVKKVAAPEGTTVTYKGFNTEQESNGEIQSGTLEDIIDGDDSTSCRFLRPAKGDYIQLEFARMTEVRDIRIQYVVNETGEWLRKATIEYSVDGDTFKAIDQVSQPNEKHRSTVIDIRNNPIQAKYLRLVVAQVNGWVNISDFSINNLTEETPIITTNGFSIVTSESLEGEYAYQLSNMIDGDDSSYCRFSRPAAGNYIQLEFLEEKEITDVEVQYYINDKNEYLNYGTIKYSVDGSNFYNLDDYSHLSMPGASKFNSVIDVRNNPKTVKYLRLEVVEPKGWVNIAEIKYNTLPSDTPFVLQDSVKMYRGGLYGLIDDQDDTFCWFNGKPNNIVIDYQKSIEIRDVKVLTGKDDGGDTMKGILEYSQDNSSWETLGNFEGAETVFDIVDNPINARYLRLVENGSAGWVAVREIKVNTISATVKAEGDFKSANSGSWNAPENMFDGDLDTAMWYDWHFSEGSSIILDLREVTTVKNVAFFQGGYTYANGVKKVNDDKFDVARFYYSIDNKEWIRVNTLVYYNTAEIFIDLSDASIEARLIKLESGATQNKTGVVIREFAVNFEKVNIPFSVDNKSVYSYTGEQIIPEYTLDLPYGVKANVTFKDNKLPVKPGKYEMTISTEESKAYNTINETFEYVILDTYDHYIESWGQMLDSVDGNICEYLKAKDENALSELIDVFENYLSKEDYEKVANYNWNGESTIAETIDYVKMAREFDDYRDESNGTTSLVFVQVKDANLIIPLAIIIVTSVAAYYIIEKRKVTNN